MDRESKVSRASDHAGLERAIVLQLLRDDHERMWSHAQLAIELESELEADRAEIARQAVEKALKRLERDGVLGMSEHQAWASNAARRLDELGLIAV
jgi:biotin operon repressor